MAPSNRRMIVRHVRGAGSFALAGVLVLAAEGAGQARAQYDSAYFAWDRGEYVGALEHARRALTMPGGDALVDRVALLTGELHPVIEVAGDGQGPRWAPDGSHATVETGTGAASTIHLVRLTADSAERVASMPGWDANLGSDGRGVVYFRLPGHAALARARAAVQTALDAGDGAGVREARGQISRLESEELEIVSRSLVDGSETVLQAPGIERHDLATAGDGTVILVGRLPGETDRYDVFVLRQGEEPRRLSNGPGIKGGRILSVGESRILYTLGTDRFAIQDLDGGSARVYEGREPAVARDGSAVAFLRTVREADPVYRRGDAIAGADVRADGAVNAVMVVGVDGGEPRQLKQTTLPLANLAISPSGRRIAYNTILRDDWEIFVLDVETGADERLTREIQHDLFPVFLSDDRILALMGEARHRRSYLYELDGAPGEPGLPGADQRGRIRLFDNNTVRTVTPQYGWEPSPSGDRVLVVADRDGNTLSPERGVYLVDLTRKVGRDEVLARIEGQLASERQLREWGRRAFAGFEDRIRAATEEVDPRRVYDHAHALHGFGSKFITQPGNALAIDYLATALRGMGYEAELQRFEPRPGVPSANVVATLRGTERPDRVNIVSSHFDSVEQSPGADDNTSGTTALLEAARVLAGRPQPETIRFVFFTGEEAGLLGSREYVRRAVAANEEIVAALNNDMVGWAGDGRLDDTIRYSNATIRDLQHNAAILFSELITYDARYVRSTDAQAFWDGYGDIIGGIGSYPILGNPHYHQPHDQIEVINHRLVAEVAKTTIATIVRLANGIDLGND